MAPWKADQANEEIRGLQQIGLIEPAQSSWVCGLVMARKQVYPLRFCCNFRNLNYQAVKDAYPIPRIDETLARLGINKYFTILDLVPLREEDRPQTTFACALGLFQWKRMPFGLCNAKATFRRHISWQMSTGTCHAEV